MGLFDKLKGAGENYGRFLMAEHFGPDWREKMEAAKLKNEETRAQTGLIGAETERSRAGAATEGLRQQELQQRMNEITRAREDWDAAVKSGLLKGQNAEVQKAIIDAAEADVRKKASEASVEASRASTAHSRAATSVLLDPTERALKQAALRDMMRYRRAQTDAAVALTENRERGPARQPSGDSALRAQAYAEANVNRGRSGALGRFFNPDNQPSLEKNSPEYMREIARLKQEYYKTNPETAGGWSASGAPGPAGTVDTPAGTSMGAQSDLSDGVHMDPESGVTIWVKNGRVIRVQMPENRTGLGGAASTVDPENDY